VAMSKWWKKVRPVEGEVRYECFSWLVFEADRSQ
jgi:hypothetical protein